MPGASSGMDNRGGSRRPGAGASQPRGAQVDELSLGVMGRSRKENERRLAINPLHIRRIAADLQERIYLERGYGEPFGVSEDQLAGSVAGLRTRAELFAD